MGEFLMTEEWLETLNRFKSEAKPLIDKFLSESFITWITGTELMEITEEDIGDFLSRDPVNGYWHPETWAQEVEKNFMCSLQYYFDLRLREKKNGRREI